MNAPGTLREVRPAAVRPDDIAALGLIRTWIGFDTTSRESNLALIDWTRAYLETHQPHLLRAYDADFLVDAIQGARNRFTKAMTI